MAIQNQRELLNVTIIPVKPNLQILFFLLADFARQLTKTQMKMSLIDKLLSRRDEDIEHFVNFITKDSVQKTLGFYLEQMKKKQKKWMIKDCVYILIDCDN